MRAAVPYLTGALAAAFSFVSSGLAGLASLVFLVQILSKEEFGAYSFGVNVMILATLLATVGLDRALLLRLAPYPPEGRLLGRAVFRRAFGITTLVAGVIGGGLFLLALGSAGWAPRDLGGWWIMVLVPSLWPMAWLALARAWFQANHQAGLATAMPGVADAARAAMIGVVLVWGLGKDGVAVAFCLSAALPLVLLAIRARGRTEEQPAGLSGSDIRRGVVFSGQRIADVGLYLIDIIIIGLVASDAVTAQYAIAARLAAMTDLGRLAMIATFTPRARLHHHAGNTQALRREYRKARLASCGVACCIAIALMLFGQAVLAWLGDFADSFGPMLILASGYVFSAAGGLHASYLAMTGEVRNSALIRAVGLAGAILGLITITPLYGSTGAAIVITATMFAINGMSMLLLWRRTGFRAFGAVPMLVGLGAAALLWGVALALVPPLVAGGLIAAGLAVMIGAEWPRRAAPLAEASPQ